MQRLRGRVIWYCATKGFGFISRQDGPDVFLHQGALLDHAVLPDGAEVEFELPSPDASHATNVAPLKTSLA